MIPIEQGTITATATWRDGSSCGIWRPDGSSPPRTSCARCALDAGRSFLVADFTERPQVGRPEDAAELLLPELAGRDREACVAALLDTKHRLLTVVVCSVGSVDHTFMGPREIFRDALLANASALVLAHNHPSGDPEPSRDDELVTRRLVQAGAMIGVELLDHLVVGGAHWVSLARRGRL